MLKNHSQIAWRNLLKNKWYSSKEAATVFKTLLLALLIQGGNVNSAWAQDTIIYQPEAMQADLNKFKTVLIKTHPGLYTHQTHKEFEELMSSLMQETSKPLKATCYYKVLHKMVANIHDGHTNVQAFDKLAGAIYNQKWLPFQVYVKDQRIFIVKNMSNIVLPEGSEILSIDGRLSNEILHEILEHYSSDGRSQNGIIHSLEDSFFTAFYKIYPRVFEEKSFYNVSYRDYNSKKISTVVVEPISQKTFEAKKAEKYPSKNANNEAFNFEVNKRGNYAILKINRFFKDSFTEPENTFPDYYKKCFKEISGNNIQNLVIDLRGNEGGKSENAAYLLRYFIDKPIIPAKEISTLVNSKSFFDATGLEIELDKRYHLVRKDNGNFKVTKTDGVRELESFKPIKENHFHGKVVVLIDGGTVSAGGHAAGFFKEYTNAVLVGSETGGYAGTSNGVEMRSIRGNHTETAIRIPLLHGVYAVNEAIQKRGAIPDYQISNSVQDLLDNRDTALDFVLTELLRTKIRLVKE
jgi:hypothetical protein